MIPSEVATQYERIRPAVRSVDEYVTATLRPWSEQRHFIFTGRSKEIASVAEKLESGRYKDWLEMDDLFACTIVVPTAESIGDVEGVLSSVFDVVKKRDRDNMSKPPDVFRFDTTRVWARLRPMQSLPRPQAAEQILFEVQIPTIFQYAWSVVTRDFVYKTDQVDWKRDRLVAHLKAAVEQIELIIAGFDTTAAAVPVSGHDETDAKRNFVLAMRALSDDGFIPGSLLPESWSRLADNAWALVKSYAGYRNAPAALQELTGDLVATVRAGSAVPHSGSLFQVVVGFVAAGGGSVATRHLRSYPIVPSPELRDLHGVGDPPAPITFGFTVS